MADASAILEKIHLVLQAADTKEKVHDVYAGWAVNYDRDVKSLKYTIPEEAASMLLRHLGKQKEVKVLDAGCGTGLVGENLRKQGFQGILHGLDANQKMLDVALEKEMVYSKGFAQYLIPGKAIEADPGVLYDAVICVGTITKNHADPEVLPDILNLLTTDGLMLICVSDGTYNAEVTKRMKLIVEKLINSKKAKEIEIRRSENYLSCQRAADASQYGLDPKDFDNSGTVMMYCLQKN